MVVEDELRNGLRALTAAPEPLPYDLAERSAARAVVQRRRRVALTAVAAATAVVAAVPLTASVRHPKPLPMARSLRTWPQYVDPHWAAAYDVAKGEYERSHGGPPSGTARPLYVGGIDQDARALADVWVVWAYCGPNDCTRVVSATAHVDDAFATGTEPHLNYWDWHDGEIVPGAPTVPLGALLVGASRGHGSTTVVAVLPPPDTTAVSWSSDERRPGTGGSGELPAAPAGSVHFGNVGYVSAPVRISVEGRSPYAGRVQLPGQQDPEPGFTRWPSKVEVPAPYQPTFSSEWQTNRPFRYESDTGARGRAAVYAVCDGTGSVTLTLEGVSGPLPCDGVGRLVLQDVPISGGFVLEIPAADPYSAVAFAVGYR
jgi:hypothetical protein